MCVDVCVPVAGTNGEENVCRTDETINLNTVITSPYTHGTWSFTSNPGLLQGSTLNVSTLAIGTYTVTYIVQGACTSDTTIATLHIFDSSSAGNNGVINACKNQMIDLRAGLNGNADFGGTWYEPNGVAIASSYFKTETMMGQFVYKYVVSNGVCPNDTSEVTLNIENCNFMGVDAITVLENVTVSPNPTTGNFQINGVSSTEFAYEIVDVNGRVIRSSQKITSTITEVSISDVENGVYLVCIFGKDAERMIRIIKH